jgi:hypothetical protein
MTQRATPKRKKAGRPPMVMPEAIPDTAENVIDAVLNTPPRKRSEWKFVQEESRNRAAVVIREDTE